MKSLIRISIVMSVFSVCIPQGQSAPVVGSSLSIEDASYPNTVGGLNNAGIGYAHQISGTYSLGVGAGVLVSSDSAANLGVGWNLSILEGCLSMLLVGNENWSNESGFSIVSGYWNHMDMVDSGLVVGIGNALVSSSWNANYSAYSMVVGNSNLATDAQQMFVSGTANAVEDAKDGAVIGFGLTNSEENHIVVGRFNAVPVVGSTPVFTVANGVGTLGAPNQRNNALVVYRNGDVIITKPQGDILMGEFGN